MKTMLLFVCLAIGGIVGETIDLSARRKRASGGEQILIEQAPYYVSLRRNNLHVCGGAFISTEHVLTAADCLFYGSLGPLYETLVVGGTDGIGQSAIPHSIKNISLHESFREGKFWYDIAVITLSTSVKWNEKQNKIALPTVKPPYYQHATLTGFHLKSSKHASIGLQQLTVKIEPFDPTFNNAHDYNHIFYGKVKRPQAIADTDRGSPLVYGERIIGIASVKSPALNRHSYFVDVFQFKTFIKNSMGQESSLSSELSSESS